MIDPRLITFLTLCKEKNYGRTGDLLNISQPAVTQHIQYLEREYKCKLFTYENKKLSITKEAEILKSFAENIIYQEKVMLEQMKQNPITYLKVGATKTIGEFVICNQVQKFLQAKGNEIYIEVDNTEKLLEKLESGELDFALIEGYFDKNRFQSDLYRKEKFVGICGKEHAFANKAVSFSDLFKEHLYLREGGSGTRKILEINLLNNNHDINQFKKITTIGNFGLLFDLVFKGGGVTFAYESILEKNPQLSAFSLDGIEIFGEFNYVYLDNPESKKRVAIFKEFEK